MVYKETGQRTRVPTGLASKAYCNMAGRTFSLGQVWVIGFISDWGRTFGVGTIKLSDEPQIRSIYDLPFFAAAQYLRLRVKPTVVGSATVPRDPRPVISQQGRHPPPTQRFEGIQDMQLGRWSRRCPVLTWSERKLSCRPSSRYAYRGIGG